MDLFLLASFFLLGTIIASFIGVVAVRLHTGESAVRGRSRCDACGAALGTTDLVPLLSYAAFGGRSRCCRVRLSPLAPLAEAALGGLYALSYAFFGISLAFPFLLVALALLALLVLYDSAHLILPPVPLALFVLASGAYAALSAPSLRGLALSALVALSFACFLALLHVLSRGRAMGFSDAPLAFGLALLAGPVALAGFVYSFWIGAVVGIALLSGRPRGSRMGVEIPFAPYLAAGFLLALFTPWNPFFIISNLIAGASR